MEFLKILQNAASATGQKVIEMLNKPSNYSLGYIFVFFCCFTNAVSYVFISHMTKTHDALLSLAVTFAYATVIFTLFNFKQASHLFSSIAKHFWLFLGMNISTFFCWLGSFLSLKYLDPATSLCLGFGLIAVTNFFVLTPLHQLKHNKHLISCILFIFITMALIIKQHADTTLQVSTKMIALGVMWCIISGFSGGFIGVYSERLGKINITATQILASRFYLLVIASTIIFFFMHHSTPVVIDWKYYLLSSLIVVFFPLLMYQLAVVKLGSIIVSFLEPLTPVLTYFLQVQIGDYRFNIITITLLLIASGAVILLVKIEQNIMHAKKNLQEKNALEPTI